MQQSKNPTFEAPPINEVVFGVSIKPNEFNPVHYGLFWNSIRTDYPRVSQHQPIWTAYDTFIPGSEFPLPRVWFESTDQRKLVQIQNNKFYFNWRRLDPTVIYPRFENLLPTFLDTFQRYQECSLTGPMPINITPERFELSYINHIDKSTGWETINDIAKVLSIFDTKGFSKQFPPSSFSGNIAFEHSPVGILSLDVKQGTRSTDNEAVLVVELSARTTTALPDITTWFQNAHNAINDLFMQVTPQTAHTKWGLIKEQK